MQFIARFDTEDDARSAATELVAAGFVIRGLRRAASESWVVAGRRSVSSEQELEGAEDVLADRVLEHNGEL